VHDSGQGRVRVDGESGKDEEDGAQRRGGRGFEGPK